jgi:hypothetical protein
VSKTSAQPSKSPCIIILQGNLTKIYNFEVECWKPILRDYVIIVYLILIISGSVFIISNYKGEHIRIFDSALGGWGAKHLQDF